MESCHTDGDNSCSDYYSRTGPTCSAQNLYRILYIVFSLENMLNGRFCFLIGINSRVVCETRLFLFSFHNEVCMLQLLSLFSQIVPENR